MNPEGGGRGVTSHLGPCHDSAAALFTCKLALYITKPAPPHTSTNPPGCGSGLVAAPARVSPGAHTP